MLEPITEAVVRKWFAAEGYHLMILPSSGFAGVCGTVLELSTRIISDQKRDTSASCVNTPR